MAFQKQYPVLTRSLKAKLLILKRPMFWGSTVVILLAVILGLEYLNHPERLLLSREASQGDDSASPSALDSSLPDQAFDGGLPPAEDNGIGVDIDNLPLLFSEIQAADRDDGDRLGEGALDSAEQNGLSQNGDRPLSFLGFANPSADSPADSTSSRQGNSRTSSYYDNLFSPAAAEAQPFESVPASLSLFSSETAIHNTLGNSTTSPSGTNFPTTLSPFIPASAAPPQPSVGSLQPTPPQPQSGLSSESTPLSPGSAHSNSSNSSPFSPQISGPQLAPLPGTTGYTVPPVLQTPSNPYTRRTTPQTTTPTSPLLNSPSGIPSAAPSSPGTRPGSATAPLGYPSNGSAFQNPYSTMPTVPSPQSSDSVPPGTFATPQAPSQPTPVQRYSGGGRNGRINTFANP